jgi:perosamine synthetase
MIFFKKPLFTGFAPNMTSTDLKKACSFLFLPWKWGRINRGNARKQIEIWLKKYFSSKYAFVFDSGRTSLHYALKSLGISEEDEVLVQAYTCVVVSNAIIWTGAKPVYVDISDDFNIDINNLKLKITDKTKAIIIQHTFGYPANLEEIIKIAKTKNIKIIEDCAHALGAKYDNKLVGTFGDIGMFSFGSDKIVSCVRGGGLITNNSDIAKKLRKLQLRLPETDKIKTIQHLLHYPAFAIGKPIYNIFIGKIFLYLVKKLSIINKIIYKEEKQSKQVLFYPAKLPNSLANILLGQLNNLENNIKHRKKISKLYQENITKKNIILPTKKYNLDKKESTYLRFPLLVKNKIEVMSKCKKQGIILGNWYSTPIAPADIVFESTEYKNNSCSNAERLAKQSLNLPTNRFITKKDAFRIIKLLNK